MPKRTNLKDKPCRKKEIFKIKSIFFSFQSACPSNRKLLPHYGHQGGMFLGSHDHLLNLCHREWVQILAPPGQPFPPNVNASTRTW